MERRGAAAPDREGFLSDAAITIRDAELGEHVVLTDLQRRASLIWDSDRAWIEAHMDEVVVPPDAVHDGLVRVAVGADGEGEPLGFTLTLPVQDAAAELDGLFVDPRH